VTGKSFAIRLMAVSAFILIAAGCEKSATEAATDAKAGASEAPPTLQLSAEDLLTLAPQTLAAGPTITGSILPEKRADLRAEVSAVVLAVLKENGDPVKTGDVLVRLDDTSIRDTLTSARTAADSAQAAFSAAERQYQRMVNLRKDGLVSTQQLEDAEVRRNTTQSDNESARSRLVAAEQQQSRTQVRAPFEGIVSDRQVSAGDTAQIGKELLKVIDPRSLRFEGYVSANSIGSVRAGQKVSFRVHGIEGRPFAGTIMRVNPAANALTRQVEVLVSFATGQQPPGIAGLYAEGQVETSQSEGLALPASVIIRDGDNAYAWQVKDGKLHKAPLKLGERDPRSGDTVLASGLAAGDKVLRYPTAALHDGQAAKQP
jgi:membrane fusion protein (multidrug efflux system)